MPIPRRFDRRPPERDQTRVNERIRVPEVRLIGEDGNQVGVISRDDALAYAQQRDLDLVEVAAEARPPVVRVLDYSKYKYEQEQKAKAAKRHQKNINVREIKLRPKIAENDYSTKKGHVTRFLKAQDKVKVTIMFRGREMTHPERGERLLLRLAEDIQEIGTVEQRPTQDGRNMIMMLAPVKARVEAEADGSPDGERGHVAESAAEPVAPAAAPVDTAAVPAEEAAAEGPAGPVADAAARAAADGTATAPEAAQTPPGAPADTTTAPPVAADLAPAAAPATRDAPPAPQGAAPAAPKKPTATRKRASNAASPAPVVEGVAFGEDAGAVDPPAAPAAASDRPARKTPAAKGSTPKGTPARKGGGKGNGVEPAVDAVETDSARAAS